MSKKYKVFTPDEYELPIIRSFAYACNSAAQDYRKDPVDFLEKIVQTRSFRNYYDEYCLYTQGSHCIAGKLIDEYEGANPDKISSLEPGLEPEIEGTVCEWMGYVLMYWKAKEDVSDDEFLKYDMTEIYWAYDVLHTQSVNYAIDWIKAEFRKRA